MAVGYGVESAGIDCFGIHFPSVTVERTGTILPMRAQRGQKQIQFLESEAYIMGSCRRVHKGDTRPARFSSPGKDARFPAVWVRHIVYAFQGRPGFAA